MLQPEIMIFKVVGLPTVVAGAAAGFGGHLVPPVKSCMAGTTTGVAAMRAKQPRTVPNVCTSLDDRLTSG